MASQVSPRSLQPEETVFTFPSSAPASTEEAVEMPIITSYLPIEIQRIILNFASQTGSADFFKLRLVCHLWKETMDLHIIPLTLTRVSQLFQQHLPSYARLIEDHKEKNVSPIQTFQHLTRLILKNIPPKPIEALTHPYATPQDYRKHLRGAYDLALVHLRLRIKQSYPQINFGNAQSLLTDDWKNQPACAAKTVRDWLNNPDNAQAIQQITDLSLLDFNQRPLQSKETFYFRVVPPEIGSLTGLVNLNLSFNRCEMLPDSIENLSHLETLGLNGNPGMTLTSSLSNLKNLKSLGMQECALSEFPPVICNLTSLEQLSLGSFYQENKLIKGYPNLIKTLPPEIRNLKKLTYLSSERSGLEALPEEMGELTALENLLLTDNHLEALPDSIGHLINLTNLDVRKNALKGLPDTWGKMNNLRYLYIQNNQIRAIPDSIGDLSSLLVFNAEFNQIGKLPSTVQNLSQLQQLSLSHNKLPSVPEEIGSLSTLQNLHLDHNNLTFLPQSLDNLRQLARVSLHGNPLVTIPNGIAEAPLLKDLDTNDTQCLFTLTQDLKYSSQHLRTDAHRFKACRDYRCKTPLAALCQSILRSEDEQTLRIKFSELSDETKNRLRDMVEKAFTAPQPYNRAASILNNILAEKQFDTLETARQEVIDNLTQYRPFLHALLLDLIKEKFDQLEPDKVYTEVYKSYGVPARLMLLTTGVADARAWARKSPDENVVQLIDAMELVAAPSLFKRIFASKKGNKQDE